MPTALDNGQRSTRKQLAAVVRRVLVRAALLALKDFLSGQGSGAYLRDTLPPGVLVMA
jgi:hypothetical protein